MSSNPASGLDQSDAAVAALVQAMRMLRPATAAAILDIAGADGGLSRAELRDALERMEATGLLTRTTRTGHISHLSLAPTPSRPMQIRRLSTMHPALQRVHERSIAAAA